MSTREATPLGILLAAGCLTLVAATAVLRLVPTTEATRTAAVAVVVAVWAWQSSVPAAITLAGIAWLDLVSFLARLPSSELHAGRGDLVQLATLVGLAVLITLMARLADRVSPHAALPSRVPVTVAVPLPSQRDASPVVTPSFAEGIPRSAP